MSYWLNGFTKRQYNSFITMAGTITDIQIYIRVYRSAKPGTPEAGAFYVGTSGCQSDYSDIRFTDDNGNLLPYWIESYTASLAYIWLRLPSITTTQYNVWCYYGNTSVASASNGYDTFLFFDEFNNGAINTSRWSVSASITPTFAGSEVTVPNTVGADVRGIYSTTTFGLGYAVRAKMKAGSAAAITYPQVGWRDLPSTNAPNNCVGYYNNGGYFSLQTQAGGSTTNVASAVASDTSYHVYDIRRVSGAQSMTVDGSTVQSTTNLYTSALPVCVIEQNTGNTCVCDWIAVRKYDTTMYFGGVASDEETPPTTVNRPINRLVQPKHQRRSLYGLA